MWSKVKYVEIEETGRIVLRKYNISSTGGRRTIFHVWNTIENTYPTNTLLLVTIGDIMSLYISKKSLLSLHLVKYELFLART